MPDPTALHLVMNVRGFSRLLIEESEMNSLKFVFMAFLGFFLAGCGTDRSESSSPASIAYDSDIASQLSSPSKDLNAICPSGGCPPIGDLPGWRVIFLDDFAEAIDLGVWSGCLLEPMICSGLPHPYRVRWWAFLEGWNDNASGIYSPSRTLSIRGGVLDIYLHSEGGVPLTAAPVPLIHERTGPLGQLYGRYAVRFRADSLHGYKIAWLLWPDSETWPRDGEIDFPEGNLDMYIEAYLHHQDAAAASDQTGFFTGVRISGEWHTAVIEWEPDMVRFLLDGKLVGSVMERIPDTPMHWVLEATTTLDGYEPADDAEGHVQIDWVAVWEFKNRQD